MIIGFFMPMQPPTATHQEKKINWKQRRTYEPENVKAARAKLMAHLAKHVPAEPLQGPLSLTVLWGYPTQGKHMDGEPKTTKPDIDNAHKLLQDCMTQLGFWDDDAQIAQLGVRKEWRDIPGIAIWLHKLEVPNE